MPNEATPTLGQRIDAVLEPLYLEAEQLRQTILQATAQQQALQEQIDQAEQGLGQIESRMAQVVRELARQEPIIAAVVGQAPAATVEPAAVPVVEPVVEPAAPSIESTAPDEALAPTPVAEPAPEVQAETQPETQTETQTATSASVEDTDDAFFQEKPNIELDPKADAAAVDAAAALLDEAPAQAAPKVDLAAAAQRAAAAARQLRDKAATK